MRIVFVGSVQFSLACLRRLVELRADVVGVVTVALERSHLNADYADLGACAEELGLPVLRVRQISEPANVDWIRDRAPDAIFVFGFSQLLSPELLAVPPRGCIGTHPALLPQNRGRHPIIWALVLGLRETGLTFLYLDQGVDSGDILWQERIGINDEDDAASLYAKVQAAALRAIGEFLPAMNAGRAPRIPQDESQASYWRKRTEADGEIDWHRPTEEIRNLIRGLARPYVGAHAFLGGARVVIWKAQSSRTAPCLPTTACEPGTIRSDGRENWHVRTGDGWLEILESDPPLESLEPSRLAC